MNFLSFHKKLKVFPVFGLKDIQKFFPDFDRRRLSEWTARELLIKLRRGYYAFAETERNAQFLQFAANKIYSPSYISLESALEYYSFIPEGVFGTYSVSTLNTTGFDTPFGHFSYRHIKPAMFFGYRILTMGGISIKLADPEKAILDFLYLSNIHTTDELEAMRFNAAEIKETISSEKLEQYLAIIDSPTMRKRFSLLNHVINA